MLFRSVYGDGVNIASRLQSLAEPGGVTVSDSVKSVVRGKVPAVFEDQGEQTVKNIPEPVHAWRVRAQGHAAAPTATATATAAVAVAGLAASTPDGTAIAHALVDMSAPVPGFGGRPAIAVSPFTCFVASRSWRSRPASPSYESARTIPGCIRSLAFWKVPTTWRATTRRRRNLRDWRYSAPRPVRRGGTLSPMRLAIWAGRTKRAPRCAFATKRCCSTTSRACARRAGTAERQAWPA